MPKFKCGSPACTTGFSAASQPELMAMVAEHVRTAHRIPVIPKAITKYLELTCTKA